MSRFVLLPGAGGAAWYWSRVIPLLQGAGHEAVAVDFPGDDENAGVHEYARLVVAAVGGSDDVVLVAQSLGGFTAPLVCTLVAVRELVFVNAMIPNPGETPGAGDRFFPSDFQRGVARDRLGLEPDVVPGGHLIALSNPIGVADYLLHR